MLRRKPADLCSTTNEFLLRRQNLIAAQPDHSSRAEKARSLFGQKNNAAFAEIKANLAKCEPHTDEGAYCFYCEHDRTSAIEHTQPCRHYPEKSHAWSNMLIACFQCNSHYKLDQFAVFRSADGAYFEFDHRILGSNPPPPGQAVFIDPRSDNPTEFIILDLETGVFIPNHPADSADYLRADYTIRILGLNKDGLPRRRREAMIVYRSLLENHHQFIAEGDYAAAESIRQRLCRTLHPTVLFEMVRQANRLPGIEELVAALPPGTLACIGVDT